ncbi:MAG TPA: phosphatidylserine decarboxylase [Acetobacteraceae bacterium]|nr:phosphatidylserine decarboxylase [Acetobacteraceae bacterium]
MAFADDLRLALPGPHPAGRPFIIGGLVLLVIGLIFAGWLAWLAGIFTLCCLYFFRDPHRVPPGRPGAIVAPADGRVVSVAPAPPPPELGLGPEPRWRVSIFLTVLNVHVNRIPADGTVTRIAYHHGAFVNAAADKASELNERNAIAIRLHDGSELAVVQIAGLIARRIVCTLREGDAVRSGERFGIIRFGSRTDLYLPQGLRPVVVEGQTMLGGETVIAERLP